MSFVWSVALCGCAASGTPGAQPHDMSVAQHEATASALWTSAKNPTPENRERAEAARKMAADHRAASAALRDAETKSCTGIPAEDRDMSPFAHPEDIARVEPLYTTLGSDKNRYSKPVGAVVEFRAVPGMTQQWLQRVIDCHVARNAALGNVVPEMPYCPLVPRDVTAIVKSTASGFAVEIKSDDVETAREIARRAQALRP